MKIKIPISFTLIEELNDLPEKIVDEAARQLLGRLVEDTGPVYTFKIARERIREKIDQLIDDRVTETIEHMLETPSLLPPDVDDRYSWSPDEPQGLLSLDAYLDAQVRRILNEAVDPTTGKPTKGETFPHHGTRKPTRLQHLIDKVARDGIERAAGEAAKQVNEEAKTKVREAMADAIAAQLMKRGL